MYYAIVKNVEGEAVKPWLGENQTGGVVGIGTYKRNESRDEESSPI